MNKEIYINPAKEVSAGKFAELEYLYDELNTLQKEIILNREDLIYELSQEVFARDFSPKQRSFLVEKFDSYFKEYNLLESLIRRSRFFPEYEYRSWNRDISISKSRIGKYLHEKRFNDNDFIIMINDLNSLVEEFFEIKYFILNHSVSLYIEFKTK